MSLRELRVLVSNLPPDAATVRAIRGHNWNDLEYMVAEILDVAKFHRVEWAMSRGAKPDRPQQTNRPEVPDRAGPIIPTADGSVPLHQLTDRDMARAAHEHILAQLGMQP